MIIVVLCTAVACGSQTEAVSEQTTGAGTDAAATDVQSDERDAVADVQESTHEDEQQEEAMTAAALGETDDSAEQDPEQDESQPDTFFLPTCVYRSPETFLNVPLEASELVEFIPAEGETADALTCEYAEEPKWDTEGEQEVSVTISDDKGNSHTFTTTVTIVKDTEPPVFKEYRSHIVTIGDTVSYRSGVIITDNCMEGLELEVDSSAVNLKEAGEYPLIYSAVDLAGNVTQQEVTVTVREPEEITEEMVNNLADEVISSVINDDMNSMEALEALFVWTKKNIKYVNYFEQNDELSAAWEGLNYRKGDCYVYACVSKELLTRAGVKNDLIYTSRHYWNLVDVGDGWYHYDTCPRKDKPYFFMWGDKQLMEYSEANGKSHDYDHTKWPDVMKE